MSLTSSHVDVRLVTSACGITSKEIKNFSISKRSFEIGESSLVLSFKKEHSVNLKRCRDYFEDILFGEGRPRFVETFVYGDMVSHFGESGGVDADLTESHGHSEGGEHIVHSSYRLFGDVTARCAVNAENVLAEGYETLLGFVAENVTHPVRCDYRKSLSVSYVVVRTQCVLDCVAGPTGRAVAD